MKIEIKNIQININRKQAVLLTINIVLIAAFIVLGVSAGRSVDRLYSQQGAKRWEEKKDSYAQVSAFVSPGRNLQYDDISQIRGSLAEALSKESLNESKGNARVWIDAYSGECQTAVRKDSNTLSVTAVGVGGDFFHFHPIPLLSGGYISDEDLNRDRVVVDENFAWAMFGSNDIVGMQIWMNDTIYTVAGVVEVDKDSLYRMAYGNGNRIYMFYDMLKSQQDSLKITCYEAILPNPISNYAYYALRTACGLEEGEAETIQTEKNPLNFDDIEVVENSNRYNWMKMLTNFKNRKLRAMRTNPVGYPFWENLARVEENHQENILVIRILLLVCPCICIICWLYDLWSHRKWTVRSICINLIDKIRERQEEKAEEKKKEAEASEEIKVEQEESEDFEEEEDEDFFEEEELPDFENEEVDLPESEEELQSVTSENIFEL